MAKPFSAQRTLSQPPTTSTHQRHKRNLRLGKDHHRDYHRLGCFTPANSICKRLPTTKRSLSRQSIRTRSCHSCQSDSSESTQNETNARNHESRRLSCAQTQTPVLQSPGMLQDCQVTRTLPTTRGQTPQMPGHGLPQTSPGELRRLLQAPFP